MLTQRRVEGKSAIVTGGSKGIGKAACLLLAREGAKVAVLDTDEAAGRQVVEEIIRLGGEGKFWLLDVSREKDVARVFADIARSFGGTAAEANCHKRPHAITNKNTTDTALPRATAILPSTNIEECADGR